MHFANNSTSLSLKSCCVNLEVIHLTCSVTSIMKPMTVLPDFLLKTFLRVWIVLCIAMGGHLLLRVAFPAFGLSLLKTFFYHRPDNLLARWDALLTTAAKLSWEDSNQTITEYFSLERTLVHVWYNISSPSRANIMSACSGPCNMCSWVLSISKNGDAVGRRNGDSLDPLGLILSLPVSDCSHCKKVFSLHTWQLGINLCLFPLSFC